jgi:pimeloyl-ACP methyl ester carboxylesterase
MRHTRECTSRDGASIFRWNERGGGEPVLLLHGLLGESSHWKASLDALSGCCRSMALSLARACRLTQADVVEFTVAPRYPSQAEARGGHEWLIEFRRFPADLADFGRLLDEALAELNNDYHTKRTGAVGMIAPRVTPLPPRTFYRWMREHGKLGDQHKVPRVTNDRAVAEALLAEAALEEHTARTGSRGGMTRGATPATRRPARPCSASIPRAGGLPCTFSESS